MGTNGGTKVSGLYSKNDTEFKLNELCNGDELKKVEGVKKKRTPPPKNSTPKIGAIVQRGKRGKKYERVEDPKQLKLKDFWEKMSKKDPTDFHEKGRP